MKVYYLILLLFLLNFGCQTKENNIESEAKVLRTNLSSAPKSVNPFYYNTSSEKLLVYCIFQPLLSVNDEDDGIVPILADSLPRKTHNEGRTQLHYKIKSDAQWADGSPVLAKDVITTFKIIFNPHSDLFGIQNYFDFIDSLVLNNKDDRAFTMHLNTDNPNIIMASGDIDVVSQKLFDPDKVLEKYSFSQLKFRDNAALSDSALKQHSEYVTNRLLQTPNPELNGSGPYIYKQGNTEKEIEITKKTNWWGDKYAAEAILFQAYPKAIKFNVLADETPAILALKNNDLDLCNGINNEITATLKSDSNFSQNYIVAKYPINGYVFMGLNNNHPDLRNIKLRKALHHLIDTDLFLEKFLGNSAIPINSPVFYKNKKRYNEDIDPVGHNLELAKELIVEAGWVLNNGEWKKEDRKLSFEFLYQSGNQSSEDFAIYFKDQASKIGVEINLIPLEFNSFLKRVRSGDFEIARLAMSNSPLFLDFGALFHSRAIEEGKNYLKYSNPTTDSLIDALKYTFAENEIHDIYFRIQKRIYEDHSYIFLYAPLGQAAVKSTFKHYEVLPSTSLISPASLKTE